jgi:hypothetical protein
MICGQRTDLLLEGVPGDQPPDGVGGRVELEVPDAAYEAGPWFVAVPKSGSPGLAEPGPPTQPRGRRSSRLEPAMSNGGVGYRNCPDACRWGPRGLLASLYE